MGTYSKTLPCAPESARRARLLARAACDTWQLAELADQAALVISELMGNAVEHSGSRLVRVTVSRPEPCRVRLTVLDKSRTRPTQRTASPDDEHGRGLAIVEAVSDRWGADPLRWGKRVWAELCTKDDQ
ncbi:ATP-binding protein [Streptomyces sp. NA02950]|uniref:ATP-binding protein n=1 Tax=Streptomyces sp. NA02950 TaxID=2742137 RepID=UPI0020CAE12F|nr:ATP-binding protein [Streptomyces sp. NA02950]